MDKLLTIKYDMSLEEINDGYKLFWRKYQLKRTIIYTIAYLIALVLGVDLLLKNSNWFYGAIICGLALGLIVDAWLKPGRVRKKLINTISGMAQESYISEFYGDRVQITTEILSENNADDNADDNTADNSDNEVEQESVVTNLYFGSDYLDALENEQMFLLFVNKSNIYIYPKRCLSEEQQNTLRDILTSKSIL